MYIVIYSAYSGLIHGKGELSYSFMSKKAWHTLVVKLIREKTILAFGSRCFSQKEDVGSINATLYGLGYMTVPREDFDAANARRGTIAYKILSAHNTPKSE